MCTDGRVVCLLGRSPIAYLRARVLPHMTSKPADPCRLSLSQSPLCRFLPSIPFPFESHFFQFLSLSSRGGLQLYHIVVLRASLRADVFAAAFTKNTLTTESKREQRTMNASIHREWRPRQIPGGWGWELEVPRGWAPDKFGYNAGAWEILRVGSGNLRE